MHIGLLEQAVFLGEGLEARGHDLLHHVGGLAGVLLFEDGGLTRQHVGGHLVERESHRVRCGDVHGEHAAEFAERSLVAGRLERHDDADLAHARRDLVVDVGRHDAILDGERGGAAHRHVLADGGHHLGHILGHRVGGTRDVHGLQLLAVAIGLEGELRDLGDHGLELLVAGHEVGLGVHLDDGTRGALHRDGHEAFGGDAGRLLGGLGQALGAQPVDGGFHVAIGGGQRRFAIHHAHAGLLAQVLHHCSRDVGHVVPLVI